MRSTDRAPGEIPGTRTSRPRRPPARERLRLSQAKLAGRAAAITLSAAAMAGCAPESPDAGLAASEIVIEPASACSAQLISASLASGVPVHILEGTCFLEAPIVVPSGARLHGAGSELTDLVPLWEPTGGPDEPSNAVFRVAGEVAGEPAATTTVAMPKDSTTLHLSAPVTLDGGQWLLVRAANGADDALQMSDGAGVVLSEMVRPGGLGPDDTFELGFSTLQHHRAGADVLVVTPVTDVHLEGFDLRGDHGAFATGIEVSAAFDVEIRDVSGAGFARSLVELGPASRQLRLHDLRSRGENNSIVHAVSAMDIVIDGVDSTADGRRAHPLGVPRGLLTFRQRVTSAIVTNAVLQNGATGIRTWGGHHLHFSDIVVRDMDSSLLARDPLIAGTIAGACVDGGAGPLNVAEFGFDITFTNVHVQDCRQPVPPAQQEPVSWYLHDIWQAGLSGCSIINKGVSPHVHTMGGLLLSDASGVIDSLVVQGVNYAFQTRQKAVFDVGSLRIEGGAGAGNAAQVAVHLNHAPSQGPSIQDLRILDVPSKFRFGADFKAAPDWQLHIDELTTADGGLLRTDRDVLLAKNGNSIVTVADYLYRGDVVTLEAKGAERLAKTPSGPGTSHATVVTGFPWDYGYGLLLVAALPGTNNHVTCDSGAVHLGDLLVAGPNKRAVVNNTPDSPFHVIGKAKSAKAAGVEGLVQIGIP
jgi:hypothetical protein